MEDRARLTALIITLNGERLLGKCLESLSFCDRILIVDSFSSDRTEEIAKEHGAIFIQNKWPGNAKQIRYGIDWLAANAPTDWVLMLDCDEIISPELRASILAALASPGDKTAFSMPRRTWYFDRFLKHGGSYPDRLFRLFLPEAIRIDNNGAHQKFVPAGPYGGRRGAGAALPQGFCTAPGASSTCTYESSAFLTAVRAFSWPRIRRSTRFSNMSAFMRAAGALPTSTASPMRANPHTLIPEEADDERTQIPARAAQAERRSPRR